MTPPDPKDHIWPLIEWLCALRDWRESNPLSEPRPETVAEVEEIWAYVLQLRILLDSVQDRYLYPDAEAVIATILAKPRREA